MKSFSLSVGGSLLKSNQMWKKWLEFKENGANFSLIMGSIVVVKVIV